MNFKLFFLESEVGDVAKKKIIAPLGDPLWHPKERITKTEKIQLNLAGFDEDWWLIHTESTNIVGGKNGRILIAIDPKQTQDFAGGIFWITEYGNKKIQSIWVDDYLRQGRATPLLANVAKKEGIQIAVGPFSPPGEKFAQRYQFRTEE
jgi:hypothetical protein